MLGSVRVVVTLVFFGGCKCMVLLGLCVLWVAY